MSSEMAVARRRVLRGVAASGLAVLAGCSEPEDDDGATDDDPNENEEEDESDNRIAEPDGGDSSSRGWPGEPHQR